MHSWSACGLQDDFSLLLIPTSTFHSPQLGKGISCTTDCDFYSLGGCISPLYPSLTMNYYTCPRQCHSLKWLLQVCHTHEPSAETLDIGSGSAYIKRIRISKYIPTGQFSVWRITSRVRLMAVSSSWRPGPRAVSTVWNLVGICRRAKQLLVSQTFGQKKKI